MEKQKQNTSYFSYFSHPTTLFCAGVTSLGGYCLYDKEASLHAYDWLKQRFDDVPGIVKISGFGLGFFAWYTLWFNKKASNAQENKDLKDRKAAVEKKQQKEENQKQLINIDAHLKVLKEGDIDTKVRLAAYEAQYNQDAIKINNRLIYLEKINAQNEALKEESIAFFQEIIDKIELLEQPTQVFDQDESSLAVKEKEDKEKIKHIIIPEIVFVNLANRVRNLEIIVLGDVTTPKSFGVDSELKPSKIDLLVQSLGKNEEKLSKIEKIVKGMFAKESGKKKRKSLTNTKKFLPLLPAGRGSPRNKGDDVEKRY